MQFFNIKALGLFAVMVAYSFASAGSLENKPFINCMATLGSLHAKEPLMVNQIDSLVRHSGDLKNIGLNVFLTQLGDRQYQFKESVDFLYRGMVLTPEELRHILKAGIELNKVGPAGRTRINFAPDPSVPIIFSFGAASDALARDGVLAVVVAVRKSGVQDPITNGPTYTNYDVPATSIEGVLIYDPNSNSFRELERS